MRPSTFAKPLIEKSNGGAEERNGGARVVPARPAVERSPAWKRGLAQWSRWLHVYLSMVSFVILFFFAVTGLTLNHPQWFAGQQRTTQVKGALNAAWLKGDPARLEIVEYLRARHKLSGSVADFRADDAQLSLAFKGPGYEATVFADRSTGAYDLTETRMGLAAVLNDLHKGRDSGAAWGLLIDICAVLMTLVSASGIVLLLFLQKRRFSGLAAGIVGGALCILVYAVWVH